jgi:ribosomal protein L30E
MAAAGNTVEERIVVVSSDCPPDFLEQIKSEALLVSTRCNSHREMAEQLKKKFDEEKGPTWNVIVGHNFASNVRHIAEHYAYLYIDQLGFLIFKAQ